MPCSDHLFGGEKNTGKTLKWTFAAMYSTEKKTENYIIETRHPYRSGYIAGRICEANIYSNLLDGENIEGKYIPILLAGRIYEANIYSNHVGGENI